jgi:hypothetical protein
MYLALVRSGIGGLQQEKVARTGIGGLQQESVAWRSNRRFAQELVAYKGIAGVLKNSWPLWCRNE